jgi:hypothetical protein
VRGLLGCVGLHCYYYALTSLPLAEATVIQFLNPVLVAALAPFTLGEKPGPRDVLGTLAGFAGVLLIARPATLFGGGEADVALSSTGVLVGLFGALVSALVYLVVRKLKDEDARVVVFQLPLLVIPLTLPLAWPVWTWPTPLEWLVLLGVGVATQNRSGEDDRGPPARDGRARDGRELRAGRLRDGLQRAPLPRDPDAHDLVRRRARLAWRTLVGTLVARTPVKNGAESRGADALHRTPDPRTVTG